MGILEEVKGADLKALVDGLNFKEKMDRSLSLISEAYKIYGDGLIVANSLGKDSVAVWDLVKRVSPKIQGFIVTTRFKPKETVEFMNETVKRYPELKIYKNDEIISDNLYETDPHKCCDILKVLPTRKALLEMDATCWVTGLRCTEGKTRTDFKEVEERDKGLIKWQYLA